MRRPAICLLVLVALTTAACGDDSGGGGSTEAFCAELSDIGANQELDIENPEGLAELRALADRAPDEVRGAMQQLASIAEDLENLDEDDPASFGAVFELFADADFLRSLQEFSVFMADECGLEVEDIDQIRALDPDDPGSLFGGFETGGSGESGGDDLGLGFGSGGESSGDATVEFGDPTETEADDDPSPSSQLSDYLEDRHGTTSWQPDIISRGIGTSGNNSTITLGFGSSGVGEADALAACEAAVAWAADFYDASTDVNVVVNDADSDIAEATDGASCVPI